MPPAAAGGSRSLPRSESGFKRRRVAAPGVGSTLNELNSVPTFITSSGATHKAARRVKATRGRLSDFHSHNQKQTHPACITPPHTCSQNRSWRQPQLCRRSQAQPHLPPAQEWSALLATECLCARPRRVASVCPVRPPLPVRCRAVIPPSPALSSPVASIPEPYCSYRMRAHELTCRRCNVTSARGRGDHDGDRHGERRDAAH